jgi:hypothetical protein
VKRKMAYLAGSLAGLASLGAAALAHAGDVSVSVNLATPGLYGQITLGDVPAPELIVPRPVVAVPARVVVGVPAPEPLYLHVPPGHEKHWAKHCREYNACGRPVYFVSERWYHEVYVPQHRMHEERREIEHARIEHEEHVDHVRYEHEHEHDHDHDRDHHDHDRDHHDHDRDHHDHDDHDGR